MALVDNDGIVYRLCVQVGAVLLHHGHIYSQHDSVKLIGLFVTALVGLYTIEDLWEKFGDLKMSVVSSNNTCRD